MMFWPGRRWSTNKRIAALTFLTIAPCLIGVIIMSHLGPSQSVRIVMALFASIFNVWWTLWLLRAAGLTDPTDVTTTTITMTGPIGYLPAGTVFTDSCGRRWESLEGEVLTGVGTAINVRRVR